MTIGIQPKNPETGYGYIQKNDRVFEKKGKEIFKVKTFAEKPNLETAQRFLKSGDFLWNSGMFIWSVSRIMQEFDEYLPELAEDLMKIQRAVNNKNFKSSHVNSSLQSFKRAAKNGVDIGECLNAFFLDMSLFRWRRNGEWLSPVALKRKNRGFRKPL